MLPKIIAKQLQLINSSKKWNYKANVQTLNNRSLIKDIGRVANKNK